MQEYPQMQVSSTSRVPKVKKVIAWSGHCGMDQYVSWNLPSSELTLDIIWGK